MLDLLRRKPDRKSITRCPGVHLAIVIVSYGVNLDW